MTELDDGGLIGTAGLSVRLRVDGLFGLGREMLTDKMGAAA